MLPRAVPFTLDITNEAQVADTVASADEALGGIDVMVNTAAIFLFGPLLETPVADARKVLDVNLIGTFLMVRETVRAIQKRRRGGKIILFSSELAQLGREEHAAYCASKAGISAMVRCWAKEFGPDILVNAVAPGPIDTPLLDFENMPPEWQQLECANPLGRVGGAAGGCGGRAVSRWARVELHDGTRARRQRRRCDGLMERELMSDQNFL